MSASSVTLPIDWSEDYCFSHPVKTTVPEFRLGGTTPLSGNPQSPVFTPAKPETFSKLMHADLPTVYFKCKPTPCEKWAAYGAFTPFVTDKLRPGDAVWFFLGESEEIAIAKLKNEVEREIGKVDLERQS